MFANNVAIETLVKSDTKASDDEKRAVLMALRGESANGGEAVGTKVVSIAYAARILGKKRSSVYNLLNNGTLKGFYSGKKHMRATGITMESLDWALRKSKS